MSGVGAKRPRPQSRSRPATTGKPSSLGANARAGGRPSASGGHSRDKRPAAGRRSRLDENIELDGDFSDEEPAATLGEEAAAELTLEDTETADERRLRLAKELLRKYDAVAAGPSGGEGDEDEETGSDEESETGVTGAGATTARRGAGKVFDAIAARLKEDALAASGALYKPLAAAIMMQGGVTPSQVCFRRAHEVRSTMQEPTSGLPRDSCLLLPLMNTTLQWNYRLMARVTRWLSRRSTLPSRSLGSSCVLFLICSSR